MLYFLQLLGTRIFIFCFSVVVLCSLIVVSIPAIVAQGTNYTGNGGRHAVQGRIFVASGRRADIMALKIKLTSLSGGDLEVFADTNGSFIFKNLTAGSYHVVIDETEDFAAVRESAYIDDPGSSNIRGRTAAMSTARVFTIPIHLQPKRREANPTGIIQAALANIPAPAAALYNQALKTASEGNTDRAIVELRQAITIHNAFPIAWNDLGVLLEKKGELKQAIEAFGTAVKHDPDSFAANLNLGSALTQTKAYPEAEKHLAIALVKNGSSFRGHYYMGVTQVKLGRLDIAEQAFLKAIELGGNQSGKAHHMLAGVYWASKRYKDAADELEKYLKLEPEAKDAIKTRESIAELRKKQS